MGQEVKNYIDCQFKHGLSDSSVKTVKCLPGSSQEQNVYIFGPKSKICYL